MMPSVRQNRVAGNCKQDDVLRLMMKFVSSVANKDGVLRSMMLIATRGGWVCGRLTVVADRKQYDILRVRVSILYREKSVVGSLQTWCFSSPDHLC